MINRTSMGQLISTSVFYGVAFLIFLKGMDFIETGQLKHAWFSFFCALLNLLAGMRFAIARLVNYIKKLF